MVIRQVVSSKTPSKHLTVQNSIELLRKNPSMLNNLAEDLATVLSGGNEDVLIERYDRLMYSTDASIYEMEPVAIVFPRVPLDIQHAVNIANIYKIPILSRGAGTSLAGQTVNHAIVLDFSRYMRALIEVNVEEKWARVQPGLVIDELNRLLRPHKLQYPIDTSTKNRATIGGGIGNNSCGAHSCIYGKTIDQILEVDVVLSDGTATHFEKIDATSLRTKFDLPSFEGEIYRKTLDIAKRYEKEIEKQYPKIQRRVSGYNLDSALDADSINLSDIVVGSEGTLAIVSEAKVKLVPLPTITGLAVVHCNDVFDAAKATVLTLDHPVSAIELVGNDIIDRCMENPAYAPLVEGMIGKPGALLLVEFYGENESELDLKLNNLKSSLDTTEFVYATVLTTEIADQSRWWKMRQAGLGLLMSVKGDAKPVALVEDTAVDPKHLAEFIKKFDAIVRSHGTTAAYYGHASVGCLHIRPLVNLKTLEGLNVSESIATEIAELVLQFGGSLSGEHGDGILRGVFTEKMFGPEITEAFRELKTSWDPNSILNPGKIIDTPDFQDNLRLGPETINTEVPTILNFTPEGGLARAVELCNGQGACRKFDGGMCPSYMVTLDEEHSTRGRANILRQALNGVLPTKELSGSRVYDALDLCVECKACKSECPSGVDMAKIKYEVLTKYHQENGIPFRSRVFAKIANISAIGSKTPKLINTINSNVIFRKLLHKLGGIHQSRHLPQLAKKTFRKWFAERTSPTFSKRGTVVLFDDTFMRYYQPEVGKDTVRVLEALGYEVILVEKMGCCGRPAISKGQLEYAQKLAKLNIENLLPYAEQNIPIIGIEPSCLLTLRDEYPELVRTDAAKKVAASALLLDEFLNNLIITKDQIFREIFEPFNQQDLLLHGHCHQKAIAGIEITENVLSTVGYQVSTIQSACCGMAGSFGYEKEHYEISEAMAMRSLIPAVNSANLNTGIATTGVSCHQQIEQFSNRDSLHSVQWLARALHEKN
ncbi:MAG: oxidoreductase [Chloroflexi bacterium]|nr:oxidoreductase [Chloroflexota bacterium]